MSLGPSGFPLSSVQFFVARFLHTRNVYDRFNMIIIIISVRRLRLPRVRDVLYSVSPPRRRFTFYFTVLLRFIIIITRPLRERGDRC